jgi:MFS transporter, Spinster family, sphingosine-1-phosphate transporter
VQKDDPATTQRQAISLLLFMWIAYFLNYSDRQAITAMYPKLKLDLAMTDAQLGLIGAIFLWVYGFGCPIAGQLADKFSKRWLVVISLAVWSIVTAATGLSTSAFILLSLRAAMGISEALYMPAAVSLTANAFSPAMRSRAVATLTTAQLFGIVGGSWFGGRMADLGYWRLAFFALGAVGVIYAVPYFLFLRTFQEPPVETKSSHAKLAISELLRVPTYCLLCVAFASYLFGQWLLYSWLPNFFSERFNMTLAEAALNATLFLQSGAFLGLLSGGWFADMLFVKTKAARIWLMTASLLLCAPCLHFIGNSDTLLATRIAAAGFGLFSGFLMGNIFPASFEVVPADTRASAVGVLNFFGALVSGTAAFAGGYWKASVGMERLLSGTAILYIAAALVLVYTIRFVFPIDYERVH